MTTTVRVAIPAGQEGGGVVIRYGTQVIEVPVGGVSTFYLYDGVQADAVITERGAASQVVPAASCGDISALKDQLNVLTSENAALTAEFVRRYASVIVNYSEANGAINK